MANLFIVGASQSGKSTLAARIAMAHGQQVVSAGRWAREWYLAEGDNEVSQAQIDALTAYALAVLRKAPRTTINYIRERYDLSLPTIIEGIRNPHDFHHLFNPTSDRVIRLVHRGSEYEPTVLEQGIGVIDAYLRWAIAARLIDAGQYEVREFDTHEETPC